MDPSAQIADAQFQLGKALEQAKAGEDQELATQIRDRGEAMVFLLAGLLRLTKVHSLDNAAFELPMREFHDAVGHMIELLGAIHVAMVEGQVYVNDIRIRFDARTDSGAWMGDEMGRHQVGGFSFHSAPNEVQMRRFLELVSVKPREGTSPRLIFQKELNDAGLGFIELAPIFRFRLHGESARSMDRSVKQVYTRCSRLVSDAWGNLCAQRTPNPLPVRRMVTELIDLGGGDKQGQTVESRHDPRAPAYVNHSVQVASLSLLIGRALGMSEASLSDLGVAAVYHDTGYTVSEGGYPPPFERHGSAGSRAFLRQRGFHAAKVRRMLVCLQHHRRYDAMPKPSLYARIVKIADDFDTFTRIRPDGPMFSPPGALRRMLTGVGTLYDPDLFQIFVNEVGQYPPGTLLQLNDRSWGLVVSGARSPETFSTPLVRVVRLGNGDRPDIEVLIDLSQRGSILREIDPADAPAWEQVVMWEPEPDEEIFFEPPPELAEQPDEGVEDPADAAESAGPGSASRAGDADSVSHSYSGSRSREPSGAVSSILAQLEARRRQSKQDAAPQAAPLLEAEDEALLHELEDEGDYLPELLDDEEAAELFTDDEPRVQVNVDEAAGSTEAQEDELALLASMFSTRPSPKKKR